VSLDDHMILITHTVKRKYERPLTTEKEK